MSDLSGIYCIENIISSKKYIGKASNIRKRILEHKCRLRNNYHGNPYLQSSWNKYGEENFKFYVIEACEKNDIILSQREVYYINKFDTFRRGYNLTIGGEGTSGRVATDSQKKKIGDANRGKPSLRKGKNLSPDTILKISKSKLGHKGLKGKENPNFGKSPSYETRSKMSKSHIGISSLRKGIPLSEAIKEKIRSARAIQPPPNKGRVFSEEWKKNLSIGKIGLFSGERNPSSKLCSCDIEKIRELIPTMSDIKISKIFNVSSVTIGRIRKGRSWKNE
jgi:group I intron endonuclease